jgi:hypothetical protein
MFLEPVYLSSHFDLDAQQIKDPVHLATLIQEVGFNERIPVVERELLQLRLKQQKLLGQGINKE